MIAISGTRGFINRVLTRSSDVFIFVIKSLGPYSAFMKVKMFRPKDTMSIEIFEEMCRPFEVECAVSVTGFLTQERWMRGDQPVRTTDGHEIWQACIIGQNVNLVTHMIDPTLLKNAPQGADNQVPAPAADPAESSLNPSNSSSGAIDASGIPTLPEL